MGEEFIKDVNQRIFLDRSALARMSADEMTAAVSMFYGVEYPPVVVDNLRTFFSLGNLEKELIEPGKWVPYLLAARGIEISAEEIETLMKATAIRNRLLETARASGPDYPFAAVPEGWTVEGKLNIGKTTISRRGTERSYSIGHKALKKVWDTVSPVWAGHKNRVDGYVSIRTGGWNREVELSREGNVVLGCQTIQRYELEQVALHMGWDMPKES